MTVSGFERSKVMMEIPYQREEAQHQQQEDEEELIGVDLQPRRNSNSKSKTHYQKNSSSSFSNSETSILSSESSADSSISFEEYSQSMETNTNTNNNNNTGNNNENNSIITITKNGENPKIIEGRSQDGEEVEFQETKTSNNVALNQDSNGFTVHQNGASDAEFSVPERNGGDKEVDIGPNASKSLETDVVHKDVESSLDEGSNNINVTLSETYNIENIVNKTYIVRGNNEIAETSSLQGNEPVLEYEVEKVVRNQTTHDFFCPNCSSCITDRVILKRRKRKVPEITTDEEINSVNTAPGGIDTNETSPEIEGNTDTDAGFSAISCFSCFSIFVPKGDRFLWWRIKPNSEVLLQQDGSTLLEVKDPEKSPEDDGTGKSFPLWILTCCQPNHIDKPALKPELEPLLTSEEDTNVPPLISNEVPYPPTHGDADGSGPRQPQPPTVTDPGNQLPIPPKSPGTDQNDHDFPLWFLSCCRPSTNRVKPEPPKSDTPEQPTQPPVILNTDTTLPPESHAPVKHDQGVGIPSHGSKPPPQSEDNAVPNAPPVTKPGHTSVDHDPLPISEPWTPLPKPLPIPKPDSDVPLPTEPKPSTTPTDGYVIVPIPVEPPCPEPQGTQANQSGPGSAPAIGQPLLHRPEHPRPRVSGLDIIKAIVYGGLVECITSLSIISSAAGGDATTLNIVALGLANVFGGLVVLLHNIRVLHHEHTAERYVDQLGTPDHYMLHAVIAVLSYLIFGLMSPVIYGFTFRKSDDKNYKLATLAAASLVCITVLSIGKAYVRTPPKKYKRTIFYFLSLGVMVSGIGYVAGNLINMLLIKLGVFDSTAPVSMPGLDTGVVGGAWSSY